MTGGQILVTVVAVLFASVTQATAGFGFAVLAMPLMTLSIEPRSAVVVVAMLGLCTNVWLAWVGRHDAVTDVARRMIVGVYLGMPAGLLLILNVDGDPLRIVLGVTVLAITALIASGRGFRRGGPGLDFGAGVVSGALATSLSTSGPPLIVALNARSMTPAAFRGTIQRVFLFTSIVTTTLFAASGLIHRSGVAAAAASFPAMAAGQAIGVPLRRRVDAVVFRRIVLLLLGAAGTAAILAGL